MTVLTGDCLAVMPTMDAGSIDAIVCDPPYHLTTGKKGESPYGRARIGTGFMGKAWDGGDVAFRVETWAAALRVAKPGAHLVAFGGTRTFHRLTCAIEDAGWEIRDCLSWLYGSGFPKSHNGAWGGTALKPAWEPIILARKPLDGTVAANYVEHGTGALNTDGCRIAGTKPVMERTQTIVAARAMSGESTGARSIGEMTDVGRWPANVCLDEEAACALDEQSGEAGGGFGHAGGKEKHAAFGGGMKNRGNQIGFGDSGGASRFYYTSKASRAERNAGLDGMPLRNAGTLAQDAWSQENFGGAGTGRKAANHHPTVKPLDLMQWLCRLVTPKGGLILDPFCGSGSTGRAAIAEGFRFIGIELSEEYATIARARIAEYAPLFGGVV